MKELQKIRRINREKGQSLVEFTMSLMVILIILAGIVDLGRMFFLFIAMRDAAQEGVLYGSVYPKETCKDIRSRAEGLLPFDIIPKVVVEPEDEPVQIFINGIMCEDLWEMGEASLNANACNPHPIWVSVSTRIHISMPFIGGIVGAKTDEAGQYIPLETTSKGVIVRYECE